MAYRNVRFYLTITDAHDGAIKRHTLIHELCHVWQFNDTGPFYVSDRLMPRTEWPFG